MPSPLALLPPSWSSPPLRVLKCLRAAPEQEVVGWWKDPTYRAREPLVAGESKDNVGRMGRALRPGMEPVSEDDQKPVSWG